LDTPTPEAAERTLAMLEKIDPMGFTKRIVLGGH
jgi:hypothetical protein